jgi:hypothetical protein
VNVESPRPGGGIDEAGLQRLATARARARRKGRGAAPQKEKDEQPVAAIAVMRREAGRSRRTLSDAVAPVQPRQEPFRRLLSVTIVPSLATRIYVHRGSVQKPIAIAPRARPSLSRVANANTLQTPSRLKRGDPNGSLAPAQAVLILHGRADSEDCRALAGRPSVAGRARERSDRLGNGRPRTLGSTTWWVAEDEAAFGG